MIARHASQEGQEIQEMTAIANRDQPNMSSEQVQKLQGLSSKFICLVHPTTTAQIQQDQIMDMQWCLSNGACICQQFRTQWCQMALVAVPELCPHGPSQVART